MTVTLAAPKLPLVLPPGEALAGNIVVADIGIPPEVIDNLAGPRLELLTREGMREILQPRESDSHKGDYGHVLVDRRVARQDRRRAPCRGRRAAIGRRSRQRRDAAQRAADCRRRWAPNT